ncbi:MAG: DUF1573 domain-containing protein [Mediterranea sp.]|jgi:hypothetical protein|nr:DUF1573 domain-containing protein [Mediterranea sp.]
MKKILLIISLWAAGTSYAFAQGGAEIKFDKTTHNFGTFPESSPIVSGTFTFTNVGNAPLVIHQAVASCGCTVPEYTKEPVMPGKTGKIKVTYDGTGKLSGHFEKSITLRTNAKTEMIRLLVEGNMQSDAVREALSKHARPATGTTN